MIYGEAPYSAAPYSFPADSGVVPFQVIGLASTAYGDFGSEIVFYSDLTGLASTTFGAFDSEQGWTAVNTQHVLIGVNSTAYGTLSRDPAYHLLGLDSTRYGQMHGYFLGLTTEMQGLYSTTYGQLDATLTFDHPMTGLNSTAYGWLDGEMEQFGDLVGLCSTRYGTLQGPFKRRPPTVFVRSSQETLTVRRAA